MRGITKIIPLLLVLLVSPALSANTGDQEIPANIRNNTYFLQSVRYANMASLAFDEGDYLASTQYSADAIHFANLSDEYVLLQLKIRECDDAIAAARRRLDFADAVNASVRYPSEYTRAQAFFSDARNLRAQEQWDPAITAAHAVLAALAGITELPAEIPAGSPALPAQYTVRSWHTYGDSFWTIAGRPWVYNDSRQWRRLYDANRNNIPQPNNPDLILPGMIMVIPSIGGEVRQGMWDPNAVYETVR